MQTAFGNNSNFAAARDQGYNLLSLVGRVSRAGTSNGATAGATLVQQAIQCMFNVQAGLSGDFAGWPTAAQFDFASALTPASGGAFYVRGGAGDATDFVDRQRRLADAGGRDRRSTATSPASPPANGGTWPTLLGTRALIYGQPVADGFDWKLIPRTIVFNPFALVALCAAARPARSSAPRRWWRSSPSASSRTRMPTRVCELGGGRRQVPFAAAARRLALAERCFAPTPLQAAAVAARSIGGSASGAKGDQFTARTCRPCMLKFTQNPPANVKVNTGRFSAHGQRLDASGPGGRRRSPAERHHQQRHADATAAGQLDAGRRLQRRGRGHAGGAQGDAGHGRARRHQPAHQRDLDQSLRQQDRRPHHHRQFRSRWTGRAALGTAKTNKFNIKP